MRNFDTAEALTAMVHEATKTNNDPARRALPGPARLPARERRYGCCNFYGPVSSTLEYNTADFALSAFAGALGNAADQHQFVDRAQDWWNMLNPNSGFEQPREANGTFAGSFSPASAPLVAAHGFVEGDSWITPAWCRSTSPGLAAAKGGDAALSTYLNTVLSSFNERNGYAYVGNEPSIELPWEYDYIGQPYKTQQTVRNVQDQIWADSPGGLADGNDDLGTMSAWYVWSALGMYPMTPGTSTLALGSPLFTTAVVTLPSGDTLTINGNGAATNAPYVQSVTWNGGGLEQRLRARRRSPAPAARSSYTLGTTAEHQLGDRAVRGPAVLRRQRGRPAAARGRGGPLRPVVQPVPERQVPGLQEDQRGGHLDLQRDRG